jgi:CHASE3 domain sensor protein
VNSPFNTDRKIQVAFATAVLILAVVGTVSYRSAGVSNESDKWVKHTYEVSQNIDAMRLSMIGLESNARGFVLTGDEAYWDSWRAGVTSVQERVAELHGLTADNPVQQARMPSLEALIARRIDFGEKIAGLRRSSGLEAAAGLVATGEGLRMSNEFRDLARQMKEEEQRLLGRRTADAEWRLQQSKIELILGTVLGLLICWRRRPTPWWSSVKEAAIVLRI